jgi:hypothetical protein
MREICGGLDAMTARMSWQFEVTRLLLVAGHDTLTRGGHGGASSETRLGGDLAEPRGPTADDQ